MEAGSLDVVMPLKISSPSFLWDFFPMHFQKLATLSRSCHHINLDKERLNVKVISESSTVMSVKNVKENGSSMVTFSDEDVLLGHKCEKHTFYNKTLLSFPFQIQLTVFEYQQSTNNPY